MTDLGDVQTAATRVLGDMRAAAERGEISEWTALVFRLYAIAHMMNPAHKPGGLRIAQEAAFQLGMNADLIDGQVQARIYEQFQALQMERSLLDSKEEGR